MGLSIHYKGKIKDTCLIRMLVDEVKDICISLQWNYHLYDDDIIKGISFAAVECEPLFFTFSNEGILYSPVLLQHNIQPATTISVKTQFAGIDVHKTIIKLLKHLKANYFSEFELDDEGNYWETNDENILQRQFNNYNYFLNAVSEALKDFETKKDDTPESLTERLEKFLNGRLRKQ
jgi:hypothetical protein